MISCVECGEPPVRNTRLCDGHYREAMERAREALEDKRKTAPTASSKPKPPSLPRLPPIKIDPADIFTTDAQTVRPEIRAAHLARFVHRVGRTIRRVDAVRVAGLGVNGSSSSTRVLEVAEERDWIKRGRLGSVEPGVVPPPPE